MRVLRARSQQRHGGPVALGGRLLDRGLEAAAEVEHDIGVEDLVDLVGGELEVVGFGAGGGQVRDLDAVAPTRWTAYATG